MHPLAAPGTLWVLSSDGKYLVRPQADETSHKKPTSCGRQGKDPPCFSLFRRGFRLCGGDQRLSDRPLETFGALLLERIGFFTKTRILVEGRGKTFLAFPCFAEGFASAEATKGLSDRPLETFGVPLCDEMLASWEAERYLFATPTIFQ